MDFGTGGETVEMEVEIAPDGQSKIVSTLRHPVFPHALPIELKGITT